jgi:membrane fusion protein (multidrug efflux system)
MTKKMILMLLAIAVFIAAIGAVKFRQIKGGAAAQAAFQPPPETVTTAVARQAEWPATVNAIGTVTAVQGVTVSADSPGIVASIGFESGRAVRRGDLLVKLDTRQEEAQLAAAESQRDLARLGHERMKGLRESGVIAQADYDRAVAELQQGDARVGEIRATIERKTIRAPFSGVLGIRQVGAAVRLTAEGKESTGRITAVDSVVDPATRNFQIQATFANPKGRLRPGMFVETRVVLGASQPVLVLPATAVSYAPYGDSVFVVGDVKGPDGKTFRGVRQQFVKLGGSRGDQVAVLSGLKPGEEIVTSGVFKLRNGAAVRVNNRIQPANSPTPKPEDS